MAAAVKRFLMRSIRWTLGLLLLAHAAAAATPNILLISIDTLRSDHLSGYGYARSTSPNIDRLMAEGARFADARTDEPLTAPALTTMLTSLKPHTHGATRNGLKMRPGLPSFPKAFARRGYRTAAFVGNWTLKDKLTGLGEHFQLYREVLTRKRWFGFYKGEATAADLTDEALAWLETAESDDARRPVLVWAHYVEPHAPYRLHEEFLDQLGLGGARGPFSKAVRYDTEIAFADQEIGRLVKSARSMGFERPWLIVFTADHGESLGEHGYWGHGRHTYEETLDIPLSITWPGVIRRYEVQGPALLSDLASTLLSLAGVPGADRFHGVDWASRLRRGAAGAPDRVVEFEAHKGAVQIGENRTRVRRKGLLELARIDNGEKEIMRIGPGRCRRFDLRTDPGERHDLDQDESCSGPMLAWRKKVEAGLATSDELPPPALDQDEVAHLKALGYLD
jgi:arylsulfatase A-like enzyme